MKNNYTIEIFTAKNILSGNMDNSDFKSYYKDSNLNIAAASVQLAGKISNIHHEDYRSENFSRPIIGMIKDQNNNIDVICFSNFDQGIRNIVYVSPEKNLTNVNLDKITTSMSQALLDGALQNAVLKNDKLKAYEVTLAGANISSLKQDNFNHLSLVDQKALKVELSNALDKKENTKINLSPSNPKLTP